MGYEIIGDVRGSGLFLGVERSAAAVAPSPFYVNRETVLLHLSVVVCGDERASGR